MAPGDDSSRRRVPGSVASAAATRRDTVAHLASRHRAAARAKVIRRRRAGVVVGTLVAVAAIVAACNAASGAGPSKTSGDKATSTTGVGTTTSRAQTTTTTLPASFNVGLHQFNWTETGAGISHVGPTGLALPGRVLATEVRYPTLAGSPSAEASDAPPSKVGAPYPVIVFAHGFDTDPTDYAGLLDAWVRAGFVVVSPIFPDESSEAVTAVGGLGTSAAATLENDVYNEPGDIVYVLKQLQSVAGDPWGSNLTGVMNLSDVGLAGQSDGANVVAALSYASGLSKTYSELASPPKAVAVLSGLAWTTSSTGTYGGSATSPALLQVQSDADGCVSPALASYLYAKLQTGLSSKWFVTLLGADHLAPYEGVSPWAPVVNAVTTKFFERELKWRSSSASAASVQAAGTVTGAAQITTTVSDATIPQAPLIPGC